MSGLLGRAVRGFDAVAARQWLAVVGVGFLAAGGAALWTLKDGPPRPTIHDEFSYLLGADTFARGRLTNPPLPDPFWQAFESIHVIQQPTYSSKYPPGQALFLAAGQLLAHPVVGLWLSHGLACAALCWMLQGWYTPRWALVGALCATLRLTFGGELFLYEAAAPFWVTSYMGGSVAMLGGCLVYGAYRRLTTRPRPVAGVVLGLGWLILANTRPFEGLIATGPVAVALLLHLLGPRRPPRRVVVACLIPFAVVLVIGGGLMAAHNRAVTENPLRLPYLEHARQYEPVPVFLFQPLRPEPAYRHQPIRGLHAEWAGEVYAGQQAWADRGYSALVKLWRLWEFFLGVGMTAPLLAVPWVLRRRGVALGLAGVGFLLAALAAICVWSANHYFAPAAGPLYLVLTAGMQRLAVCRWRGRRWGRWAVCVVLVWVWLVCPAGRLAFDHPGRWHWYPEQRAAVVERLAAEGGRHLVIVRYAPDHSPHFEWVYNGADPAGQTVVWARDLGPDWYPRLRAHFPGRRVWVLYADEAPPRLEALP